MPKNSTGLTYPPLVSRPDDQQPHGAAAGDGSVSQKTSGILYYLTNSNTQNKPAYRKTLNGKSIIRGDVVTHAGTTYPINNRVGIYSEIIHKLINELDAALKLWRRVFAIRCDLHHAGVTTLNNKWLTRFFKNLRRRLERAYDISRMGFVWVREHERGKSQHCHVALYLDGDKIRHSAKVSQIISDTWAAINPANHVYHPKNQYYFVDDDRVKSDLVYRVSYMAKVRGKGYRKPTVNDFHGSSLRC